MNNYQNDVWKKNRPRPPLSVARTDAVAWSSKKSEAEDRITVNYIRHELTEYDDMFRRGMPPDSIRSEIYAAIANEYPELQAECDRQIVEREGEDLDGRLRRPGDPTTEELSLAEHDAQRKAKAKQDRAIAPAQAEYQRVRDEAWKKYDIAVAQARVEHDRVIAPARAERDRVSKEAKDRAEAEPQAEYKRDIDRAEAEYKHAIAEGKAKYDLAKSSAKKWLKRDIDKYKHAIDRAEAEYKHAIAPALAKLDLAKSSATKRLPRVRADEWAKHERVRAEAWKKYDGVSKKAKDKQDRAIDQACVEYEGVRAEAWKKYERVSEAKAKQDHADAEPEAGFDDDIMWTNLTQ